MLTIPLKRQAFFDEEKTKRELADFILTTNKLSMGEQCALFEEEFATYQGAKHAVLFNSGGSANLAIIQTLKNLGLLADGDKVGFSALTWSTNVMPLIQLGLEPVPIDCDAHTLNAMSWQLEERLRECDLRAFFITNALGFAGDLDRIREVCQEREILLIEDNCEAVGTTLPSGRTGSFGVMSSFSFYVAHHMSTIEGGMVCTDDEEMAEMLKIVRANGWDRNLDESARKKWRDRFEIGSKFHDKYTFYDLGYNLRPTEITGFLGRRQLEKLEESVGVRHRNYLWLEEIAKKNPDFEQFDHSHLSILSSFAYPIITQKRAEYLDLFEKAGIEARPMISGNIQNQPFFKKYVKKCYALPQTEFIDQHGFYVGNYPELTPDDLCLLGRFLARDDLTAPAPTLGQHIT